MDILQKKNKNFNLLAIFDCEMMIFVKNAQKSQFYRTIYDFLYYICSAKTKLKTKKLC